MKGQPAERRSSFRFEPVLHQNINPGRNWAGRGILLTVQRGGRSVQAGAHDRWFTMRDEFASYGFLAVTVAGFVLLCSGLVAFAFA
jgi:hypothetical protein